MKKHHWIAMVLMGMAIPWAAHAQVPVCGDVDEDGIANVVDALKIARGEPLTCAAPGLLTATGQTESFIEGDDGDVRAGLPLRYVDNLDGTISALNTGLTWEKKDGWNGSGNAANLHDADNRHPWSGSCSGSGSDCGTDADCAGAETCQAADAQTGFPDGLTIFEVVDALNGSAFAGHTDWRVPNYKELVSLVDLGTYNPAVDPAFNRGGSCTTITSPACSNTATNPGYWSSSRRQIPLVVYDSALTLVFEIGLPDVVPFDELRFVRAVRGGL